MMAKEIYHSPDWYEARVSEDYINPAVKHMLINDVGDEYDSHANDEELVEYYYQRWNSVDFIRSYGDRIGEIYIEEMRLDNQDEYKEMTLGYGTGEETYLQIVDEIARDLLMGSDKKLILFKKRIREEAQKPLQKKRRQQIENKFLSYKGMKPVDEDERFFTWNNPIGDKKDYKKELHYHLCFISLMSAVEERLKMIVVEEIKTIRTIRADHTERMNEVEKFFSEDIDGGWVSKWLQLPIREQINFVNEFEKRVEEIRNITEAQPSNEDAIKIVGDILNKADDNVKRLTGFE